MIGTIVILLGVYFLGGPILISILAFSKNMIKREFKRKMRIRTQVEEKKKSLLTKVGEACSFLLKSDKRKTIGVPNKFMFLGIYLLGAIGVVISGISEAMGIVVILMLVPYIAWIFAVFTFRPIRKKRDELFERIYTLKRDRMGLIERGNKDGSYNYDKEFTVMSWDDTYMFPKKIMLRIPTKFDELQIEAFMTQFNLYFGAGSKWAPDRSDPTDPGWNFTEGRVTLVHTPPLPSRADWSEEFLLHDEIAWSYFPMALGSENGVKITTSDGKEKYVLGFDLGGEQPKLAKKTGGQIGEEVVLAPQVLIAGGTGGGKALKSETLVHRIVTAGQHGGKTSQLMKDNQHK